MSRAPSENARRGAAGLLQLEREGRVEVEWRDEILRATGVPLGSWARTVAALQRLGAIAKVEHPPKGLGLASAYVLDLDRAREVAEGRPPPTEPSSDPSHASPDATDETRAKKTSRAERARDPKPRSTERKTQTTTARAEEPESSRAEPSDTMAIALVLARALHDVAAAIRETAGRETPARAAPSPGEAGPETPPPPACPVHGERVVVEPRKGVPFWGCKGWRSAHDCGTQTISLELHAANHRASAARSALEARRAQRLEAERADRMRGVPKPTDQASCDLETLRQVQRARSEPQRVDVRGALEALQSKAS